MKPRIYNWKIKRCLLFPVFFQDKSKANYLSLSQKMMGWKCKIQLLFYLLSSTGKNRVIPLLSMEIFNF